MQSMNRPAFLAIKSHSPTKPVIIFVASRRQTRLTAMDLVNFCGMEDNPRRFLNIPEEELAALLSRVKDNSLKEALQFGIGLHHAGLVQADRQLVEELFTFNKIQVLVATSTLAWGVNLPAHLVIVKGTQFFDAKIEGYRDMDLTDVLQMLGRAGRPQFDSSGIARIFTQDAKKSFYKYFLHTGFPVESSLHKVIDDHLGAEIAAGTITTKQDALDYLTWTFFFRRLHKNPTYYGLDIAAENQDAITAQEEANKLLARLVDNSVTELSKSGCVISNSNGDIDSTSLGKISSYYYLSHKTVRNLLLHSKRNANFGDVLRWMCTATEYDELPVRHNEDLINIELSKALPLSAESMGVPMWDPHVKAFLLIQAFMSRIDLPITDYITDQYSVLDQSIRIMQASIDVLAELGYLSSVKMMITLMQCIKQARWPEDGPLAQLPDVDAARIPDVNTPISALPLTDRQGLESLARQLGVRNASEFIRVSQNLPNLSLKINSATPSKVGVTVSRANRLSNSKIHAPKFPKPQTEGMFLILGSTEKDEIYALKRVSWPDQRRLGGVGTNVYVTLELPPGLEGVDVEVTVLSDGYLGVESKMGVRLQSGLTVVGSWVVKDEENSAGHSGTSW
jgi:antiviral helicase SLH1